MTIFFTAHTHLGDHCAINISRRPFADVGPAFPPMLAASRASRVAAPSPGASAVSVTFVTPPVERLC